MDFLEHHAKTLLAAAGIAIPEARLADSPEQAAAAVDEFGAAMIKAQVAAGKRGKAGAILPADDPQAAGAVAERILGMTVAGHPVETLLIERRARIKCEYYAAVINDSASRGPLVMFSNAGGIDIEALAARDPQAIRRRQVDIRAGFNASDGLALLDGIALDGDRDQLAETLARLYRVYRDHDAELVEVNPLALTEGGELVALDCKFTLDDSAIKRQAELAAQGVTPRLSELEMRGRAQGLNYIELDGDVGVLANGAGLTMTTMDVIVHHGGHPANFLEIGGDAYTQATPALELVLANPRVRSLVVNFCGSFARTDVMTGGVIDAWETLRPTLPVFFSIRGTGREAAVAQLERRLGMQPRDSMDEAVAAAVNAAARQP